MIIMVIIIIIVIIMIIIIIGDKAAVMQQCLADTPEFAARLGSALQARYCLPVMNVFKGVRR